MSFGCIGHEMIDNRIEESLVRESLMKIDASSMKNDIFLLLIFFGIIITNFIVGCTNIQEHYKWMRLEFGI